MPKVTLTAVSRNNKTSQAGKPYVSLGIKCNEYGDKYINGFGNKDNQNWKVGDTVEVIIEEKGQYLNFSTPKSSASPSIGVSNEMLQKIYTEAYNAGQGVRLLAQRLEQAGVIPSAYKYPEHTPTAFDEPEGFKDDDLPIF